MDNQVCVPVKCQPLFIWYRIPLVSLDRETRQHQWLFVLCATEMTVEKKTKTPFS